MCHRSQMLSVVCAMLMLCACSTSRRPIPITPIHTADSSPQTHTGSSEWWGNDSLVPYNTSYDTAYLYDEEYDEERHPLEVEAFSKASGQKDPELLDASPATTLPSAPRTSPIKKHPTLLSRAACVSMLGEDRFRRYVTMLGSELGARKRCTIMNRLGGT